ncbi:MAG: hypothetical protein VW498_02115 [Candidatus Thalassarchaeaceae archaeon]
MNEIRIIRKVKKGKWECQHADGTRSYHKTLKKAREYVRYEKGELTWLGLNEIEAGRDQTPDP